MVIAYAMVCACVWAVLQSLSEMTIAFPVSGNYIDYADRWVDPALAFGAGFAEWLGLLSCLQEYFHILTISQAGLPSSPPKLVSLQSWSDFGHKTQAASPWPRLVSNNFPLLPSR